MRLSTTGIPPAGTGGIVTLNPRLVAGFDPVSCAGDTFTLAGTPRASVRFQPQMDATGFFSTPAMLASGVTPPSSYAPPPHGAGGIAGGGSGSGPISGDKLLLTARIMQIVTDKIADIKARGCTFSTRAYETMEELFGRGVLDMTVSYGSDRLQDFFGDFDAQYWGYRADAFEALSFFVRRGIIEEDQAQKVLSKHLDMFSAGFHFDDGSHRTSTTRAYRALIEAGLIDQKLMGRHQLLDKFMHGLDDTWGAMPRASAEAMIALIRQGLIDRETVEKRYLLDRLLSKACDWRRDVPDRIGTAIIDLVEKGLVDKGIAQAKLADTLSSYIWHLRFDGATIDYGWNLGADSGGIVEAMGDLLAAGLLDPRSVDPVDGKSRTVDIVAGKAPVVLSRLLTNGYRNVCRGAAGALRGLAALPLIDTEEVKSTVELEIDRIVGGIDLQSANSLEGLRSLVRAGLLDFYRFDQLPQLLKGEA